MNCAELWRAIICGFEPEGHARTQKEFQVCDEENLSTAVKYWLLRGLSCSLGKLLENGIAEAHYLAELGRNVLCRCCVDSIREQIGCS